MCGVATRILADSHFDIRGSHLRGRWQYAINSFHGHCLGSLHNDAQRSSERLCDNDDDDEGNFSWLQAGGRGSGLTAAFSTYEARTLFRFFSYFRQLFCRKLCLIFALQRIIPRIPTPIKSDITRGNISLTC